LEPVNVYDIEWQIYADINSQIQVILFEELRLFGQVECKNDATRMKVDWTGRCTFGENFVG